jgi:hypothetical protein
VQNNKSFRIIHNGSNKIGFAVFRFFYDFLRNLQEAAKTVLLFELPIAGRPSKGTPVSQCGPWADRPARLARIRPLRWGIRPGDGWGRKRRSLGFGLWPQTGGGALVGGRPATSRRAGRGAARLRWCSGLGGGRLVLGGLGGRVGLLGCLVGNGKVGVPKLAGGLPGRQLRPACTGQQGAPACAGQQRPK